MKMHGNKIRKVSGILVFVVLIILFSLGTAPAYAADGLNVTPHTKAEIVQRLKSSGVSIYDDHSFATVPVKYNTPGELSDGSKQNALKMLNNIRYIAGVPDVTLDETLGKKAQAAAFVNWCIDDLTHHPGNEYTKPEGMDDSLWTLGDAGASSANLAWGQKNLNTAVLGWMEDDDAGNIPMVGHRRWAINPEMGKVGFGASVHADSHYAQKYYAECCHDLSGTGTQTNVAWPARYMPVEYFGRNIPWSLSLGSKISSPKGVEVTLTRRSTSPSGTGTWTFSGSESYTAANTGKYFNINNDWYGQTGCIIFRPDNISYKAGDIFDVSITGAAANTISYTVEFFSGFPVESISFDKTEYVVSGTAYVYETVKPDGASNYEITWETADKSVATVNDNGLITAVSPGTTTVTATIPGNYTNDGLARSATATVTVPKSINSGDITVGSSAASVSYNGKVQKPELEIKDGNKTLTEGVDYEITSPLSAKDPDYYAIRISGKGAYYGSRNLGYFQIKAKSLDESMIAFDCDTFIYNGSLQKPVVTVMNGDLKMTENVDYTITNNGGAEAKTYTVTVRAAAGSSFYSGSATKRFVIEPQAITAGMISDIPSVTYNGSAQTPDVTVTHESRTLVKNTDYTVTYSANTDAGTAKVTVTGKGNYKGSAEKSFTIGRKAITAGMISDIPSVTYSGSVQTPDVTVTHGSRTLVKDTDYTVAYSSNTDAGTAKVTVTGKGNYEGSEEKSFTISRKAITAGMISDIPSRPYTGSEHKPAVTVTHGSKTLAKGTDYTLAYSGNTNAGTATVTVTGVNNYSGSTDKTFEISPKAVTESMLTLDKTEFTYNGEVQRPDASADASLDKEDYEIVNNGGTDKGTYKVTLRGKRNYSGSVEKSFVINAKSLDGATIGDIPDAVYTGSPQTPDVAVSDNGTVLAGNKDYTVEYSANTDAGTAKVTVTGKGNYTDTKEKTFTISRKAITEDMISDIPSVTYSGSEQKPDVTIRHGGRTLVKGTDYTADYSNNVNEGTAAVTIRGKGNYDGSAGKEFRIILRERAELYELIGELEDDLRNESDEDFRAAVSSALEEARSVAENEDADAAALTEALGKASEARTAAGNALEEKKKSVQAPAVTDTPGADTAGEAARQAEARANQKGRDGTDLGAGASAELAEAAILSCAGDEGPKGSRFAPLMLKSTSQSNTGIKLTWTNAKGAKKYVIYGNACGSKNRMKKLAVVSGRSYNAGKIGKKLKKGTYHKFMVVALDSNNDVVSASKVIHVATKGGRNAGNPTKLTVKKPKALTKGKKFRLAAKQTGKKVKKHRAIRYESSDTKIASVSGSGVITARSKGNCYVYAYAQNGLWKKVRVTVR